MYFWLVKKVARFHCDVIQMAAVMHHYDMEKVKAKRAQLEKELREKAEQN